MQITDPVADMLTRIRNANTAKHEKVDVPASNLKKSIAQILLDEGYIKSYEIVEDGTQGIIRIQLKYMEGKTNKQTFPEAGTSAMKCKRLHMAAPHNSAQLCGAATKKNGGIPC